MLASEYSACGVLYCALTWDAWCEGGFAGLDKPLEGIDPLPVVSGLVKKQKSETHKKLICHIKAGKREIFSKMAKSISIKS